MANIAALRAKVNELAVRQWDIQAIESRVKKMVSAGIPRKKLNAKEMTENKDKILDRVQLRAEEYNFYLKNCAQGTALALMEKFGLGNMEIIKALTAYPGIGGTGDMCGGITGSLVAFGLYFGPDNPPDFEKTNKIIMTSQKFMAFFEREIGYMYCADIIETVILGHRVNPGESDEAMGIFSRENGFEKCGLPPGIGVRIAAGIIIDSMK